MAWTVLPIHTGGTPVLRCGWSVPLQRKQPRGLDSPANPHGRDACAAMWLERLAPAQATSWLGQSCQSTRASRPRYDVAGASRSRASSPVAWTVLSKRQATRARRPCCDVMLKVGT
ncbi:MAG: hypothetical protein NZM28_08015 [Fimbriimonadales bacterium]|nr:hypothetical protein [Fimbriimonadales bacterium]